MSVFIEGFLTIVRFMYRIDGLNEDETPRKKLGLPESPLNEQQINCEPQDICIQQEAWSTWNVKTMSTRKHTIEEGMGTG